jgi:hypothetical protein
MAISDEGGHILRADEVRGEFYDVLPFCSDRTKRGMYVGEDLSTLCVEVVLPDEGTRGVNRHLPGDEGKLGCLDPGDLHIWRARPVQFDRIEDLDVGHAIFLFGRAHASACG